MAKLYEAKWALLGLALVLFTLWISLPYVAPIVFAMFMYYITRPIKRRLQPYVKNEALLAFACLLLLTLPLLIITAYVVLFAVTQLITLLSQPGLPAIPSEQIYNVSYVMSATNLPVNLSEITREDLGTTLGIWYEQLKIYSDSIFGVKDMLFATGMTVADAAFKLLLMFIIAYLLLLDDDRLARWFKKTFPGLMREHDGLFPRFVAAVDEDFERIFFGNMLSIVFFGAIAAVVYWLLSVFAPHPSFHIPFPVLLGILSGIAALLPILGGWMIDVPILLYVLFKSLLAGVFERYWWYWVLMAVVIFIVVENLPNYLLRPFMYRGKVHVGLLMLAYIIGPIVFGFPGLFLGAMLLVILTHYFKIVVPGLQKSRTANAEDGVRKPGAVGLKRRRRP